MAASLSSSPVGSGFRGTQTGLKLWWTSAQSVSFRFEASAALFGVCRPRDTNQELRYLKRCDASHLIAGFQPRWCSRALASRGTGRAGGTRPTGDDGARNGVSGLQVGPTLPQLFSTRPCHGRVRSHAQVGCDWLDLPHIPRMLLHRRDTRRASLFGRTQIPSTCAPPLSINANTTILCMSHMSM